MSNCEHCGTEFVSGSEDFGTPIEKIGDQVGPFYFRKEHSHERCRDVLKQELIKARASLDATDSALELLMERYNHECSELVTAAGIPWQGKSHEENVKLLAEQRAHLNLATQALQDALDVSQDRQAFVMMDPRAWARAEQILRAALTQVKAEKKS